MRNDDVTDLYTGPLRRAALAGKHRSAVGGLWESLGHMVTDYLVAQGLRSEHTLVDIGCGSLRIGRHLVPLLETGNYYGIDPVEELIAAGFEHELGDAQQRLPRGNLVTTSTFEFDRFDGDPRFDFALAQSVFTHLPLNHLHLCLERLRPHMTPGGRLFATFLVVPASGWAASFSHGEITSHPTANPYHHRTEDIEHAAQCGGWVVDSIDGFDHPRAQLMAQLTPA